MDSFNMSVSTGVLGWPKGSKRIKFNAYSQAITRKQAWDELKLCAIVKRLRIIFIFYA